MSGHTTTSGEAPSPTVATIKEIQDNPSTYICRYIKIKEATVTDAVTTSDRNGTITDASSTTALTLFAGIKNTLTADADAYVNVTGLVEYYNSNPQIIFYEQSQIEELVSLTISPCGYSSLYYGSLNLSLPEGLKGYVVTEFDSENSKLKVSAAYDSENAVPAGNAVIIEGTAGETYTLTVAESATASTETNLLKGTDADETVTSTNNIYFFGYSSTNEPGFFEAESKTSYSNGAHKAYIELAYDASSASAKPLTLDFGGSTTAIGGLNAEPAEQSGYTYTLQGVKVNPQNLKKGVYVRNGRKFIVK